MDSLMLSYIKKYQREFREIFSKELIVDFEGMNGIIRNRERIHNKREATDEYLKECIEKHGASLQNIKDRKKRIHAIGMEKERKAMMDFSNFVIGNRLHVGYAASLVNRHRTCLYSLMK